MLEAKLSGRKLDAAARSPKLAWEGTNDVGALAVAGASACNQSMPVSRIMTTTVTTLSPRTSIEAATATILACGISGAPVVDHTGRPTGMVSKTDLLEAWQQQAHSAACGAEEAAAPIEVGDIMVPYLLAVSHRAPISLATALMAYEGVHRLVVLGENNEMVGIVTSLDILRWVAQLSGFCLSSATRKQRA